RPRGGDHARLRCHGRPRGRSGEALRAGGGRRRRSGSVPRGGTRCARPPDLDARWSRVCVAQDHWQLSSDGAVMEVIRISSTGAGVNYYPEFVARELGFFADEGLDVKVEVLGNGPGVPREVGSGAADVGLGGIWLPMLYRGRLYTFRPFAQLCNRLAAVLLARRSAERFSWADLSGRIVVAPGGAPNFWMVVASTLRRAGVDPSGVRFVADFMAE